MYRLGCLYFATPHFRKTRTPAHYTQMPSCSFSASLLRMFNWLSDALDDRAGIDTPGTNDGDDAVKMTDGTATGKIIHASVGTYLAAAARRHHDGRDARRGGARHAGDGSHRAYRHQHAAREQRQADLSGFQARRFLRMGKTDCCFKAVLPALLMAQVFYWLNRLSSVS